MYINRSDFYTGFMPGGRLILYYLLLCCFDGSRSRRTACAWDGYVGTQRSATVWGSFVWMYRARGSTDIETLLNAKVKSSNERSKGKMQGAHQITNYSRLRCPRQPASANAHISLLFVGLCRELDLCDLQKPSDARSELQKAG